MNNIYIVMPAYFKTGGTELGHQLISLYNKHGYKAKVAYIGYSKYDNPINPAFLEYVDCWEPFESIEDREDNLIIFPEIYTHFINSFKNAKTVIWWMSVDNFLLSANLKFHLKTRGVLRTIKWILFGGLSEIKKRQRGVKICSLHLYQSEYARLYLNSLKLENVYPLSDYINDTYFLDRKNEQKQDLVLFNPKKGFKFTKELIESCPQFKWVPLENLSTDEVSDLLRKSKVYIDFGNHPGKDRFPREAAISCCCVITGKRGSAGNDVDVPIPSYYKFDESKRNIKIIIETIEECLNYYDKHITDFELYRNKIKEEKSIFEKQALEFINMVNI